MGRNIKLVIEYDGTNLSGWQRQANAPTVQEHVENGLREMTREATTLTGASRTDAGVHALGQVANFRTETTIPVDGFRLGLNAILPEDIAIVDAAEVADDFHARFSASGKHYRYKVLNRADPSPLRARTTWHRPRPPLDVDAMRAAAAHMVGERDFSAFRATGCTAKTAIREVTEVSPTRRGDEIWIEVRGNAFLRNMVRIMAGTLVRVGEGRLEPAQVTEILDGLDRTRAGQTAPARGLTLVEVYYGARR